MDFSKLKAVKKAPPPGAGPAASGESPLAGHLREAKEHGEWRCFAGISTAVIGTRKQKSDGKQIDVRETHAVAAELKRAARQLEYGLTLRVVEAEDGKTADIYYQVGEKRKYTRKTDATEDATANADGAEDTE